MGFLTFAISSEKWILRFFYSEMFSTHYMSDKSRLYKTFFIWSGATNEERKNSLETLNNQQ